MFGAGCGMKVQLPWFLARTRALGQITKVLEGHIQTFKPNLQALGSHSAFERRLTWSHECSREF